MESRNDEFCNIINEHIKKKGGFDPPMDMDEKAIKADEYAPENVSFEGKWYKCPYCKKSLFMLHEGAIVRGVSFRCKACKHDIEVNV